MFFDSKYKEKISDILYDQQHSRRVIDQIVSMIRILDEKMGILEKKIDDLGSKKKDVELPKKSHKVLTQDRIKYFILKDKLVELGIIPRVYRGHGATYENLKKKLVEYNKKSTKNNK